MKTIKVCKCESGDTILTLGEVLREIEELPVANRGENTRIY